MPEYDSQTPVIVDDDLGSPETAALRYEAEALRANGGDYRGASPPTLLPMATFKPQPTQLHGFADSPYSQYSTQSFSTQQTDNTAAHINQVAYGTANSTSQYIATQNNGGLNLTILSCHPGAGTYGTKMILKVSALYDLQSLPSEPYAWITFGSYRTAAQIIKGPQASNGACTYSVSADVPQFGSTNCASPNNVPLGLVIESNGEELTRLDNAGFFTYHDAHSGSVAATAVAVGGSGDTSPREGNMRKRSRSPEQSSGARQRLHIRTNTSPLSSQQTSPIESATNSYGYPPSVEAAHAQAQAQAQVQADSAFAAGALTQDSGSMLGAYRSTGYGHYSRAPPALRSRRSSGWQAYSSHYDAVHGSSSGLGHANHTAIARPGLTPLSQHNGGPQLIRTSTLSSLPGSAAVGGAGYSNPYAIFPTKASLEISGDLEKMAEKWTQEEWDNRRRIVVFKKSQQGSHIQTTFRAVPLAERPPNSICISCIYWAEKQECFVTSVDTIHLLEQLVVAPARFTVEEKNRIRRNLEGFHPLTVSKGKSESEEFFKIIMAFGNPKPRNIEKDVKVFRWKDLGPALKKIISKYSQSPSSTVGPASMPTPLLTPVSLSGSYPALPPAPGSATTSTDPASATGYITSAHHHGDSIPSPRSISGIGPSWVAYPPPNRTLSPGMKLNSPAASSGYRVATLPAVYDPRTTAQHVTSPYGVPSSSTHHAPHHPQNGYNQAMMPLTTSHSRNWDGRPWEGDYNSSRNWDGYTVADGYSTSNRMHSSQTPVYGSGPSGDGASRV
ncbi:hypothetical protein CONLIGDRAFT_642374 [Coniochaeta ligniaria NRRL 30616]|uniref:DUF7082 domain-containing protein n=1 Tax=Coniochaeta ligniaria NRRL 30616 TaxID=1408157 RepID=A0A1J7JTH7_9PEZI|nr:hypothetical protein CONLIGDRAFT_642374 [Coniochaeta ligniaria NRRL 30616]